MNSNLLSAGLLFLFFSSCMEMESESKGEIEKLEQEVLNADVNFSKRSVEIGWRKAFIEYADTAVIKLNNNKYPSIGKQKLIDDLMALNIADTDTLTWRPLTVNVTRSGDLASSFGDSKYKTKTSSNVDTIFYGNYITVWKRQNDGSWKFILDGGNPIPGPIDEGLIRSLQLNGK